MFASLLACDGFFVGIFALAVLVGFTRGRLFALVNLDVEMNPAAWYSSVQLFVVALPFLVLGLRLAPDAPLTLRLRRLWLALGLAFVYLSMDEAASVHERLAHMLRRVHFNFTIGGSKRWIFFYLVLLLVLLFVFRNDLRVAWHDWRRECVIFAFGFAVLMTGALVLESFEAIHRWVGLARYLEIGVEEGFEMLGATIIALPAYRILAYAVGYELDRLSPGDD